MTYVFLDVGKFVAAFAVVFIHTEPFREVSLLFSYLFSHGLMRQAVPFFFLVSGFFLARLWPKDGVLPWRAAFHTMRRALFLYLLWGCLYLPLMVWTFREMGADWQGAFFAACREALFGMYQLWFFLGLAEAVLLLALLSRCLRWRSILWLGGALYAGATLVYGMGLLPMDVFYRHYVRGAVFLGVPWMMAGVWLSRVGRVPLRYLFIAYGLGTVALLAESAGDFYRLQGAPTEFFFSLVLCVPALFLLLRDAVPGQLLKARSLWLRRMSTLVYGLHGWPVVLLIGVPSVAQYAADWGLPAAHVFLTLIALFFAVGSGAIILLFAGRVPWLWWLHWFY